MKRINLTVIHIIIALVAVMFGSLKGQQNPILLSEKPEIIAYRLVPSWDVHCQIKIEIVEGLGWDNLHEPQMEETMEVIMDRIVFEETSRYAMREMFYVDNKPYYLVRLPFTDGQQWAD
jgi:hypothetical protein|tara:strand:+ start:257 stop:613 length:357 start_codon:yes stop_codon:yes gene_type:complete